MTSKIRNFATFVLCSLFTSLAFIGVAFGQSLIPGTKFTGTVIGTAGSWNNSGNTIAKAFDGDASTFVDLPTDATAASYWCGLDLGQPYTLTAATVTARASYLGREQGATIEAASDAAFTAPVTLATIQTPAAVQTLVFAKPAAYRYVRYHGQAGSHCNVAELAFFGTPVSAAAMPATFVTGVGTAATVQATYAVGQSPAVAYCDARALGDLRTDTFKWDFGAPATVTITDPKTQSPLDLSTALRGPIAQFPYSTAGTYTIKLTITKADGSVQRYAAAAVVAADARKHYYFSAAGNDSNTGLDLRHPVTGGKLAALASQADVYLTAIDPTPVTLTGTVQLCNNVVIDGPFGITCTGVGFAGWAGRTDAVVIRGATVTSLGTPATMDNGYGYTSSNADFINVRGTRVAIIDVQFGTLGRAVYACDPAVDGLLILGCKQLDPRTIKSQVLALFDGSRMCVYGSSILGSATESGTRLESSGSGFSAEYNLFSEDIDAAEGITEAKAAIVTRYGQDAFYGGNVVRDASFSITAGGATEGGVRHQTINTRVTDNFVTSPQSAAFITIESGAVGCTVDGNTIDRSDGPAIQVVPTTDGSWPCADILVHGNHLTGSAARVDVEGATPSTVVATGAAPAGRTILISKLVTDVGFNSSAGSALVPAATAAVDVMRPQ